MHILIPESILPASLARLKEKHSVHYDPDLVKRPAELLEAAKQADAMIVRRFTQVRGALLDGMSRCKAVGRLGVGLDNIDVETCKQRGITVIPALGANARSVAEYVITTAMMLVRTAYQSTPDVIAGKWPRNALIQGKEIFGCTLGIVGFGAIGRLTAELASALGMQVMVYDTAPSLQSEAGYERVSLSELYARSDVITLHVPLTPDTRNLINADSIACMKDGAIVINAARGGVVDENALINALRQGKLGGAALDTFENEPLAECPQYADVPNLILTPHIAGMTVQAEERVNVYVVEKLLEVIE